MDKKTIKILGYVVGVFLLFVIILFLIAGCSKGNYTYDDLKDKIVKEGTKYFEKEENLPKEDGETKTYTLEQMIKDNKIKPLKELFNKEDISCEGSYTAYNNNGNYLFIPELTCDNGKYTTDTLIDHIIKDNLVTSGVGLYKEETDKGTKYIFKGETKKNYLGWNDRIYQIIRINEDGTIKAIELTNNTASSWDNRYNESINRFYGFNTFLLDNNIESTIKNRLSSRYDKLLKEEKGYIKSQTLCINGRNEADTTHHGESECQVILEKQPYGLLSVYEFFEASLSDKCTDINDRNCRNYNWMNDEINTWTITPVSTNNYQAYFFNDEFRIENCNTLNNVQPVIVLNEKIPYVSGNGTYENPYRFLVYEDD